MLHIRAFLLSLLTFLCMNLSAQIQKVDSLVNLANNAKEDSSAANYFNRAANLTLNIAPEKAEDFAKSAVKASNKADCPDKAGEAYTTIGISRFYRGQYDAAIAFFDSSKISYMKKEDHSGVARSYTNKGIIFKSIGNYDSAMVNYQKALEIYENDNDKFNMGLSYLNLGNLYSPQGNYPEALKNLYKSLSIFEEIGDKLRQATVYSGLGAILGIQKEYEKSIDNFKKALSLYKETKNIAGEAESYNNIGRTLYEMKEYTKATMHYKKALKLYKEINFVSRVGLLYYNLGDGYNKTNMTDTALMYFAKAEEIFKETDDKNGLAYCYSGLGESYFLKAKFKTSVKILEKAKKYAADSDIETQKEIAEWLSKAYAEIGNYKKAYKSHLEFQAFNDSIFSNNNERELTRMEMQYEFDKQKRLDELAHVEELKRQRIFTNAILVVAITFIILGIVLVRSYIIKKKANTQLKAQKQEIEYKNIELEQQKEEITAQRDEIETKSELIEAQRDLALKQKQEITDSILYAKRIQTALLPTKEVRSTKLPKHFILFRPLNIVSGDFFWMQKVQNKIVVIAADCTGHGVPGAFMSMLGISLINEIVPKLHPLEPHIILEQLREKVMNSLHQTAKHSRSKDGMDMALAVITPETQKIEFAGAYNPMYIIKRNSDKNELVTLKGNRSPVGIHIGKPKPFTKQTIEYSKGDRIYLFSDGFADQFGGENNQKLKYNKFRELITDIQKHPIEDQLDLLNNFFDKWKGNNSQIDDLLIIGMEL